MSRKRTSAQARARSAKPATTPTAGRATPTSSQSAARSPSASRQAARPGAGHTGAGRRGGVRPTGLRALVSNQWVFGLTLLAVVAIAIFAIIRGASSPSSNVGQITNNSPLRVGATAPGFELTGADGKRVRLSDYRGQVVLLELFAPWCPHCQRMVSRLNQIASTDADQGVRVISVSASPEGLDHSSPITMDDVKRFVADHKVSYAALFDPELKVANAYGLIGYPQMYVIDRNGVIQWNNGVNGEPSYQEIQAQIIRALQVPYTTPTPAPATPASGATATPAS